MHLIHLYIRSVVRRLRNRIWAIRDSLFFKPGKYSTEQFIRYTYYRELEAWIPAHFPLKGDAVRVIEFGGSNGVIRSFFPNAEYDVAPNYPKVDIHHLEMYSADTYDCVVIDQILEHVADPDQAIRQIHRILKAGGVCICATPFMLQVHAAPYDYWRYTEQGLKVMFGVFTKVDVYGWGNRLTVEALIRWGWITCAETKRLWRVALWNEPNYPVHYLVRAEK